MTGCRIGLIRMKAGGAEVRRLVAPERNPVGKGLVEDAIAMADDGTIAYVVVAWDKEGAYQVCSNVPAGLIPGMLLPAYVAECIRREVCTAQGVRDVIESEYSNGPNRRS